MRLLSLKLKGISTAFPDLVELPLAELEPGIVAVTGANGQGKTVILEAPPAAIYRKLPSRKGGMKVADFAIARDSFLVLEYEFGAAGRFRSTLSLDGQTGKTDALLQRVDDAGALVDLTNGQATTYDAAIKERFPSLDLFLNSSFAAQGRGDEFARATPSKRKDLFAEFLSLRRLLSLAETAGAAAAKWQAARDRLNARLSQLRGPGVLDTDASLEELARSLADRLAQNGEARARQRDVIARLENDERLAADAVAAYAAADAKFQETAAAVAERQHIWSNARDALTQFESEAKAELEQLRAVDLKDIDERIAGNQTIQTRAAQIRAAVSALARIDAVRDEAQASLDRVQLQRDQEARDLAGLEARVSSYAAPQQALDRARLDADLLGSVPCGGRGDFAGCSFLVNATEAAGRIAELEARLAGVAEAIAARDASKLRLGHIDANLGVARGRRDDAVRERAKFEADAKYAEALAASDARLVELRERRAGLLAARDEAVTAATARHGRRRAELQAAIDSAHTRSTAADAAWSDARAARDLAADGNAHAVALREQLSGARAESDRLVKEEAFIVGGQESCDARRRALADRRRQEAALLAQLQAAEREYLDWASLQKGLGKGGLPDLEIDAAGPTISGLTNELLLATYGPRFSLELVTQVEKSGGDGMRDEFTVRVLDNEAVGGGWRDIGELSGGERVIVQEALMLGISVYVNQRAALPIRTLWRDENDAALDGSNVLHYLQMLRAARTIGGFEHIFFVSHRPEMKARADAQIQVANGRARIVRPPFEEAV